MQYRDDREAQRQRAEQLADELKVADEQLSAHEAKDVQDEKQLAALKAEVARLKRKAGEVGEPATELEPANAAKEGAQDERDEQARHTLSLLEESNKRRLRAKKRKAIRPTYDDFLRAWRFNRFRERNLIGLSKKDLNDKLRGRWVVTGPVGALSLIGIVRFLPEPMVLPIFISWMLALFGIHSGVAHLYAHRAARRIEARLRALPFAFAVDRYLVKLEDLMGDKIEIEVWIDFDQPLTTIQQSEAVDRLKEAGVESRSFWLGSESLALGRLVKTHKKDARGDTVYSNAPVGRWMLGLVAALEALHQQHAIDSVSLDLRLVR